MRELLAAAVQLNSRDDPAANLAEAMARISQAAATGARLIVLPEYTDYLGPAAGAATAASAIPGRTTELFAQAAAQNHAWLVAGSIWESDAGGARLHNTVTTYDPDGRLLRRYRKMHLFDIDLDGVPAANESALVTAGSEVVHVDLGGVRVGLSTCYDLRFPEMYRMHAVAGCQLFAIPSAFRVETGRDHWEVLLRARAIENQCYIIAANQVGQDARGATFYGRSMIVDPWGTVIACAPDQPGIITGTIDLDRQAAMRARMPVLRQRRTDVYGPLERARP